MADATDSMPTARLGRSGLEVSRLSLGTMTFGDETDQEDAFAQLDRFAAAGGTTLDTADVYGDGESERIIGRWLATRHRGEMVIATKGRFAPPAGSAGASRRSLVRSVDGSLQRLGVDAIDLYYVHGWDPDTAIEETLDTLSSLVRAGKVHHVGWSNVTGWQLATIMTTAREGGYVEPCVLQPQYNLLGREIEVEVLPCCADFGIATAPWSPLGGGWLTGKYERHERPTGATRLGEDPERGLEAYDTRNNEHTWKVLDAVDEIAAAHDVPMPQVAIAWLLTRPTVATVLLGARTDQQLAQTIGAIDLELTEREVGRLTALTAPGLPQYPYGMIEDFADLTHWRELGTAH